MPNVAKAAVKPRDKMHIANEARLTPRSFLKPRQQQKRRFSLQLMHFNRRPLVSYSKRLPTAVANIRLELAADEAGHAVAKPEGAQRGVVAALVQVQLAAVAEAHVDLAVPVDVGHVAEGARRPVEVEDAAAADVDVETDILLASRRGFMFNFYSFLLPSP